MAGGAHKYTLQELNALTIDNIKKIAGERNYNITATLKSEIISQFLIQQGA